jgi:adenosylcobinamide-GDP ribazoletransferase
MYPPLRAFVQKLLGALVFYTQIPLPHSLSLDFDGIARFAPLVGLGIGGILTMTGILLVTSTTITPWLLGAIVVTLWVLITGALHLDGAMDTADGWACLDRDRRLDVMRDPHNGAFGIITAIVILLLKVAAIAQDDLVTQETQLLALPLICGWARWGQLIAIVRFPYLRAEGKGKLHKTAIKGFGDALPSLLILLGLQVAIYELGFFSLEQTVIMPIAALFFSWGLATWIDAKFGGHTGDTYGAIVEWTETFLLCLLALIPQT